MAVALCKQIYPTPMPIGMLLINGELQAGRNKEMEKRNSGGQALPGDLKGMKEMLYHSNSKRINQCSTKSQLSSIRHVEPKSR